MNQYVIFAQEGLLLVIYLSLMPLIASLIVGLLISFFQALTQIQEQTLTFVPKIIITITVIVISAPFMVNKLMIFGKKAFQLMMQI